MTPGKEGEDRPRLSRDLIDSMFPADLPEPAELEQRYPPRKGAWTPEERDAMRRNGKPPLAPEERDRLMSREFFHADHFERGWLEATWSRPMDYAAWLTSRGFKVYFWRPPRGNPENVPGKDNPAYTAWKASRLLNARISWFSEERDMRLWTEGHGHNDDDAIAMAYGRYTLYRERKAAGALH